MIDTHPRLFRLLCVLIFLVGLLCAWLFPLPLRAQTAPVYFSAQWDSATSATVQWTQSARGCLYRQSAIREHIFIGCYDRFPATITITLGHVGPLSGDLRPTAGDTYVLVTGGETYRTSLKGRRVYLPAMRR